MAKKARKTAVKAKKTKRTSKTKSKKTSRSKTSKTKAKRTAARKRRPKKRSIAAQVSGAVQGVVDTIQETSALRKKMSHNPDDNS